MLEPAPHQEQVQTLLKVEAGVETPDHLDVSKVMQEKNAFFVHTIQVTNQLDVSSNNKSGIDTKKLSVANKLDLLYGTNPTVSASTLRPHTSDGTFSGGFGVIFSHGEVEHAGTNDQDTYAVSLKERHVIGGARNGKEDIDNAIDRNHILEGQKSYNELVLKSPEVAGGFMKLENYQNRISYEEEQQEYYDGSKTTTKIGVIDMSNEKDRYGNLTKNFDVPFSTLIEMQKRGKVFVMDEANQMYIVQNIDESSRKVEFVTSPIEPKDFAYYYGKEKMNPYLKKEMRERLEGNLKEKGMTLQ